MFLQRFDGSLTIWPKTRIRDWFRLLTDPDSEVLVHLFYLEIDATLKSFVFPWHRLSLFFRLCLQSRLVAGTELDRMIGVGKRVTWPKVCYNDMFRVYGLYRV